MSEDDDYVWLLESTSLGVVATMLIFNGMPLLGATVAFVACLEDDYSALACSSSGLKPRYDTSIIADTTGMPCASIA